MLSGSNALNDIRRGAAFCADGVSFIPQNNDMSAVLGEKFTSFCRPEYNNREYLRLSYGFLTLS